MTSSQRQKSVRYGHMVLTRLTVGPLSYETKHTRTPVATAASAGRRSSLPAGHGELGRQWSTLICGCKNSIAFYRGSTATSVNIWLRIHEKNGDYCGFYCSSSFYWTAICCIATFTAEDFALIFFMQSPTVSDSHLSRHVTSTDVACVC